MESKFFVKGHEREQAKRYINGSGTVSRDPFTYTFRQTTMHDTSRKQFVEAVEIMGGWIVEHACETYWCQGKKYYFTVANVPDAVIPYRENPYPNVQQR
jgi:hypothetical protein